MADSLSLAMLALLESSPPSSEPSCCFTTCSTTGTGRFAAIVGKSAGNVRVLATRARRHVEQRRPRFHTTRELQDGGRTRVARTLINSLLSARVPGVVAPCRGQRGIGRALSRPTPATDRRRGARHRRRSDQKYQLDRQPRQAEHVAWSATFRPPHEPTRMWAASVLADRGDARDLDEGCAPVIR